MPLSPFALCIIAIVLLGALGLPIGHSMIAGSILYLLLSGLDLGTADGQVEVVSAAGNGFEVLAHSRSGHTFTITRSPTGVSRTCAPSGQGGCRPGGAW